MTATPENGPAAAIFAPRPATQADHAAMAGLLLACARHYWGIKPNDAAEASDVAGRMLDGRSSVEMLIGWRGGGAVAFATFAVLHPAPAASGVLFMKDLFVRDGERGRGTGAAMMRAVAATAVARGCTRLDWTAEASNPEAIAFYQRIGAARVAEKVYFRFTDAGLRAFAGTE